MATKKQSTKDKPDSATAEKLKEFQNRDLKEGTIKRTRTPKYKPKKRQRMVRRRVYDRYYDLRDNEFRTLAETEWEIADKEFRMYFPEHDNPDTDIEDDQRSHLHLPDAFAAIQASMQETIDRRSRPFLDPTEPSDEPIEQLCNAVITYNMNTTNFDYQYYLAKLNAAIRGTSFLKEYWRLDKRVVKEPTDVDEDGMLTYKDKEVVDIDDSYTEWVENEYIYIDEKARHIDFAIDGVEREILELDEFYRMYSMKPQFMDVDKVQAGGETTTRSYFKLPKDINENDVEILHYYNRAIDAYWVVANNVVIHDGPIPYSHKELPFSVLYHYQVPGRFHGLGIPKIIHYLSEERRSIRNLNMDRQHLQINKMFIHNNAYDLDEEDLISRPNGLISVDTNGGSLRDAIMPIEYGDVPPSYFRTEEVLLEDIRRAHGIDDRIQGVNVGGTATEAAILKESALKRVNLISTISEMDTIKRIGKLKWSNIQFFYPLGRMEKITQDNEEKKRKVVRKITVDGKKFSVINKDGKRQLSMEEVKGKTAMNLDKDIAKYLRNSFDITIDSTVHAPTSKAIQQTKITETLSLILSNQQLTSQLDPRKTTYRSFEAIDEDPNNWMMDAVNKKDMQSLADSENLVMKAGQPLDGTEGATEDHTLVHLNYMNTAEFEQLPDEIQTIFVEHVMQEHDNNPNTGASADAMRENGVSPDDGTGNIPPGAVPPIPPGVGPAINPMGLSADAAGGQPQAQVADIQGANFNQ